MVSSTLSLSPTNNLYTGRKFSFFHSNTLSTMINDQVLHQQSLISILKKIIIIITKKKWFTRGRFSCEFYPKQKHQCSHQQQQLRNELKFYPVVYHYDLINVKYLILPANNVMLQWYKKRLHFLLKLQKISNNNYLQKIFYFSVLNYSFESITTHTGRNCIITNVIIQPE